MAKYSFKMLVVKSSIVGLFVTYHLSPVLVFCPPVGLSFRHLLSSIFSTTQVRQADASPEELYPRHPGAQGPHVLCPDWLRQDGGLPHTYTQQVTTPLLRRLSKILNFLKLGL